MRLTHVELHRLSLPLVSPFRTSYGVETVRHALLVRVLGPEVEGWGECVAELEPSYTSEYVDGAQDVMRRFLVPLLRGASAAGGDDVGGDDVEPASVAARLAPVRGHPMAKAALEAAVFDASCRQARESLGRRLGAVRERVPAGVSIGIQDSLGRLVDVVGGYLAEGYRRVKLKIEPGHDVDPVAVVREQFGDDVLLQVDANQAYTLAETHMLAALDPYGLLLVEQPLAEDDLSGHAELARRIRTPICLDESIVSLRTAVAALELGACQIVNIKPGRVGGIAEAVRIHDLCVAREVPVWCGGMLETGIGRAANVALAALPGFTLPGDLSASARYFHRDVTDPFVLEDGCLRVPTGPGIGVAPAAGALADFTESVETLRL